MQQEKESEKLSFERTIGRVPPQSIDSEIAVLGSIMLDPEAINLVKEKLKPRHFYYQPHARIYDAMLRLRSQEKPVDMLFVLQYLRDNSLLEQVGGMSAIANLVNSVVSAIAVRDLAELIIEKWRRRELGRLGSLAMEMQYRSEEQQALSESIDELQSLLAGLQQSDGAAGAVHISEDLANFYQEMEELAKGDRRIPGIPCGFYDLDAMTCGFQPGDLIILGARPSMGKTALAAQIAANIAMIQQLPVLIFSLEMSRQQMVQRLVSAETGIDMGFFRTGRITDSQWEPLAGAIERLAGCDIYISDESNPSPERVKSECLKVRSRTGKNLGFVVLDYLQLMCGESDFNRATEIDRTTRLLKQMAKDLKIPVMVLSQLSRNVESRTNKRPVLSDLRESGGIEQNADLAIMLYRDEYYNSDSPDRGLAELIIAKHRNGPTGAIKLLFDQHHAKFKNLVRPDKW